MPLSESDSDNDKLTNSLSCEADLHKERAALTGVGGNGFATSLIRNKTTTTTNSAGGGGGDGETSSSSVLSTTLVISNTSSCTLQMQSGNFAKNKKIHSSSTYTVQFNCEKTKTTKAASTSPVSTFSNIADGSVKQTNCADASSDDDTTVNIVMAKGRATMTASPLSSSPVAAALALHEISGARGSASAVSLGAQGGNCPNNATVNTRQISSTSSKPCCFCWCCCCSCSWIRRRCLSVKTPNGSVEPPSDFFKDEELRGLPPGKISSWGESFEQLMANETGRKVFRSFLRCEYSEENILFWLACEELKKERTPELVEEKARIIYEDYVSILSPREVSLDSRVREIINRNMIAPSQHTFDEAQLQIYTLMHRDSYPRFVNSSLYRNMLRNSGARVESPIQPP